MTVTRQAGHAAVELVLGAGLLVLPVAVLVMSLPTWVQRETMAQVAAQEAARSVVLAGDPADAALRAAALVETTAANHGVPPADVAVCHTAHSADSQPPTSCTGLVAVGRHDAVTTAVTVRLPALVLPGLPITLPSVGYTARHTEYLDPYRSR